MEKIVSEDHSGLQKIAGDLIGEIKDSSKSYVILKKEDKELVE
jgi:hypothetical protein